MADTIKYAVIRTDLMSGTKQPADLVSFRFYDADDKPAEVENGTIVELKGLEDGEREVYKAVAATADSALTDCVVAAGVEVMYDERKKNLEEYVNEAGKIVRGYVLRSRNIFSLTPEGFDGGAPAVGDTVGIGTGGKLKAGATGFGVCTHVETAGRHEYHAVRIGVTEA